MLHETPVVSMERRIWLIRGQRVMLDSDLAEVYGVATKRLNEQVKRNRDRFPGDFAFQLSREEARTIARLRSQNATLKRGGHIKHLPFAFTEHGAVMLASVLNSPTAVAASIQVVRAFVRLRELLAAHDGLGRKLDTLVRQVRGNTRDIQRIFESLEDILEPSETVEVKKIGFQPG